jgi:hypothetical protein
MRHLSVALAAAFIAHAGSAIAQPVPLNSRQCALLAVDLGTDTIYLVRDIDGDGRAEGPLENTVFFGAGDASGLGPLNSMFAILQTADGTVYVTDGDTDAVYALRDLNGDLDAMDAGEATAYFGSTLVLPPVVLATPQGLAADASGRIYVTSAQAAGQPSLIWRTADANNDGDARDPGEYTLYLDTTAEFAPNSSILFGACAVGNVLYFVDQRASLSDTIFQVDPGIDDIVQSAEIKAWADDSAAVGAPVSFTVLTDGTSIYSHETSNAAGIQRLVRYNDADTSGIINDPTEVISIWDETFIPAVEGVTLGNSFDAALGRPGVAAIIGNGTDVQDNIFLLKDFNNDGDFFDPGETIVWTRGQGAGVFPENLRAVTFYRTPCRADFNISGAVTVQDIFDFLSRWNDNDPCANFNAVDGVTVQDIFDFLSEWATPCP